METKNLEKAQQKKSIESELETEQVFIDILEAGNREKVFAVETAGSDRIGDKAMLQDWYVKRWKYARRQISVDEYAEFVIGFIESAIKKQIN